ncbi:PREDICTED: AT-rich interactive domain-containing protein 5B-like isoform X2 [Papilio polytes]|uniref:AT-rich interactive domain-containing protein 5B-like isoform X2 n=1 Tax=Papilio polytes TaxID=76194 RepID=UPI000675FB4E|nr:PREDICTED: AT-rich interactive domain-containing protein 5B-like isoform X2 [Papilio polytes]
MEKPSYKLVGAPCGQHGQYTFYKALRLSGKRERIVAIGDFFFVRIWQDSELVSIGELQLLWTDRVSDQTLVSLRLYFLPENTPEGRCQHGEDEVLAINDKVVVRAEDLLSWVSEGSGWRWGLRAVWRGACAPPADPAVTAPLHHTKLDFSDVEREKNAMSIDADSPGVMVFSYPRYCRYRAIIARLDGMQADWLRDSLVAALGGYAAPTKNTRILYCKETFEYPELEGHEFVCNHLAPRLKGRPRGRRRRARSRSASRSDSDDPDAIMPREYPLTPRRLSLRNGGLERRSDEDSEGQGEGQSAEDREFLQELGKFHKERNEDYNTMKHLSLRTLYVGVCARGGYEAVCRARLWPALSHDQPARARRHYERYLLPFENHERKNGTKFQKINGHEPNIDTIELKDSPLRELNSIKGLPDKRLRTPSPKKERVVLDNETGEVVKTEELNLTSKPAEELNREFLDSLPKEDKPSLKISVKPVEELIESDGKRDGFFNELTQKLNLALLHQLADRKMVNGHPPHPPHQLPPTSSPLLQTTHIPDQRSGRPLGRSSLRAVRVKPARPPPPPPPAHPPPHSASVPLRTESASSPQPALNNFGIHHPQTPPNASHSDDEIVEVPYKPKTPEIIDLDEYPESPQGVKKKKLDILKERGLEVTAVPPAPPAWPLAPHMPPLAPLVLNPAVQHQIMTQAQLFHMYNILPPHLPNGVQPPKVIQGTGIFGSTGPEKTVYGNPKDPFMPPPHVLHGVPVKPQRAIQTPPPHDVLDLTCKLTPQTHIPAVEIVRVPPSPPKAPTPQNLSKNYTVIDGKAVVGSNLEITLVNPKSQTPPKRPPQKRSSNGKFMSAKTPTPPKEYPKPYQSPAKKNPITIPTYHTRDTSPSSTGSRDSNLSHKSPSLAQMMELKSSMPPMAPFMDPVYMNALYNSLGHMDQRQLAVYRDLVASQFRGYTGLLNIGTPTTKN